MLREPVMILNSFQNSLRRMIFPTIGLGSYFMLLGALAVLFLVAPLLTEVRIFNIRVSDMLSLLILLVGVWAVAHSRIAVIVLTILALCTAVPQLLDFYIDSTITGVIANSAGALFLVALFTIIVVDLFRTSEVTGATLAAACCGYVLIAGIFAAIFSLIITFDPNALTIWQGADFTVGELTFQNRRFGVIGYYSIVTLTTLGYGDIAPNSDYSRSVAALEAVIGQLYLAVIVARLVGMYIAGRSRENTKDAFEFD